MDLSVFSDAVTPAISAVIASLFTLAVSNFKKFKDLPWETYLEIKYRRMKLVDELLVSEMRRIDEQIDNLKQEQHGLHPGVVEPELRRLKIMKRKAHRIYYKRLTKSSERINRVFKRWASQTSGSERRQGMIRAKIAKVFASIQKLIRPKISRLYEEEVLIDGIGELWAVPRRTRKGNPHTETVYISPIYWQAPPQSRTRIFVAKTSLFYVDAGMGSRKRRSWKRGREATCLWQRPSRSCPTAGAGDRLAPLIGQRGLRPSEA